MFCALFIPAFRLQAALRHRPERWKEPVAVVSGEPSRVVELTPAATRAGVEPGMSPNQALARCLELQLLSRGVEEERSVSETLLGAGSGAAAYVEQTAENICTLDLQGCRASVSADFEAWGTGLLRQLASLRVRARIGIAENPDLALLAAQAATRAEPVRVVRDGAAFLEALPLDSLAPPASLAAVLEGWGVTTLGGVTRLKKEEVAARLGPGGVRLWEQAGGRSRRLLRLERPPERFEEAFDFEHELDTAQPLLFLLRRFVDQLAGRLEMAGRVAAELRLALPLSDGSRYERVFQIPSPTVRADVLFRILDTHFENLRLEFPPTGVRLAAQPARPEHQQFRLFENSVRDPNRFAETLARIMALVGSGNAGTPEHKPTHKPDQFALRMPDFASPAPGMAAGAPPPPEVGLPLRRFRPPLPAQVHLEAEQPRYVVSEQAHGNVVEALGPYRLSGDWWEGGWQAEEWDVQMADGGLYRLARHGETWEVEGCYDREEREGVFRGAIVKE